MARHGTSCPYVWWSRDISGGLGQACWSDEDFVGRVARASRRHNHPLNLVASTMTKLLIQYRDQWDAALKSWESGQQEVWRRKRSDSVCARTGQGCDEVHGWGNEHFF